MTRPDVPPEERQRVAALVVQILEERAPEMLHVVQIEWAPKLTGCMGKARYVPSWSRRIGSKVVRARETEKPARPLVARVKLSIPLWLTAMRLGRLDECTDTVIHEVAHLLTDHLHGTGVGRREPAHGARWRHVFREIAGYTPRRCHSIPTETRPHELHCDTCGETCRAGRGVWNRVLAAAAAGRAYYTHPQRRDGTKCGGRLWPPQKEQPAC